MLNEERFGGPLFFISAGNTGIRKLNYTNKSEVNHLSNFTKNKINRVVESSGERNSRSLTILTLSIEYYTSLVTLVMSKLLMLLTLVKLN